MQKPTRIIQYGVGAMGSNMVRFLQNRNAVVVGAIDIDPKKIGRDLGDVCGLGRKTSFVEIPPGRVYGFKQNVYGYKAGREMVTLNMVGVLDPREDDGFQLGDYCLIEGSPDVQLEVKRDVSQKGGLATAANAVNMIPRALAAVPGLITMKDLTLPHIWHQSAR